MLKRIIDNVIGWLNYLIKLGGFSSIMKTWQKSNAKDRGILLIVFSPMVLCFAGLCISLIYFILFVLPMFLFRIVGCGILASLAAWGGRKAYKYFTGTEITPDYEDVIDVEYTYTSKRS